MSKGVSAGGHEAPVKGATNEWYTPPYILEALGPFDDDPAMPGEREKDLLGLGKVLYGLIHHTALNAVSGLIVWQNMATASDWYLQEQKRSGLKRLFGRRPTGFSFCTDG